MSQKIVSKECRFVVYIPPKDFNEPDYHLIKEIIHYEDNTSKPNIVIYKNFKRKFYITKKGCQNHTSKKEYEKLECLVEYETTQSKLQDNILKALRKPYFKGSFRQLCEDPYIYGVDVNSTTIIKQAYMDKYPDKVTMYSTAVLDIETDVINGNEEILMCTISYRDKVYTAVVKDFLKGYPNAEDRIHKLANQYIGDSIKDRNITINLKIVDNPVDAVKFCIDAAHEMQPDFLAIWNIDFEMTKFIQMASIYNIELKDIFSDPKVPKENRFFQYIQGPKQKKTASGLFTPIKPAAQWHTVLTPSSFYIIDAMCTYKHTRIGKPEEPSYSLDAILNKEFKGKLSKLKIPGTEEYSGLKWHQDMQTNHKLEYVVYNMFDCISVELLEEKTKDLGLSLPTYSGSSDFRDFKSQPRRAADDLHFFHLKDKCVISSTGSDMGDDFTEDTVDLRGWIVALPAHLIAPKGLKLIKENPLTPTNVYPHAGDLDIKASYPNGEIAMNVSKETTVRELVDIEGIPTEVHRQQTINLSGGATNAIEFCTTMYNFPELVTLLEDFRKQ